MSYQTLISKFKDALGVKKLKHMMDEAGDTEPGEVWKPWAETVNRIAQGSNPETMKMDLAKLAVYSESVYKLLERKYPSNSIKGRRVDSGLNISPANGGLN
jgi:hypothetical protein